MVCPGFVAAQQPDQQPTPPVQPVQPVGDNANAAKNTPQQPANNPTPTPPLLAATDLTFALPVERSYLAPSLSYYGQLNSNAFNAPNSQGFQVAEVNSILGGVVLQKVRPRSQMNLGYLGGGTFSAAGGALNSTTQDLALSQAWTRGRWAGAEADEFSYSSGALLLGGTSPFDLVGLGQVSGLGSLGPILIRDSFRPSQSIFTPVGPRLTNAAVAQVDYQVNARTTFVTIADYDILHFFESGLVDSYAAGFQTGLSRQLTRRDTLAVAYRFNSLWFNGSPEVIRDHVAQLAFERALTRRVDVRIGAGPDVTQINVPGAPETRVSWAGAASLRYATERMGYGIYLDRGVTSGSGVFLGAVTSTASAAVQRQLSRLWSLTFDVSYGRNVNLISVVTPRIVAPAGSRFNAVYGGFLARRQLGENSEFFFGYTLRRQTSDATLCSGGLCGSSVPGNVLNFGFVWRPREIPIN